MTHSLAHRGPDSSGLLVAGAADGCSRTAQMSSLLLSGNVSIGFGHRRLSIVDTSSAGHQPMSYMGGRYWITYNGEIFNHNELRQELLKLGCEFRSRTDTEVILAAYEKWGISCLGKFNGMFAFAILDMVNRSIFIARDRLGVKPLYFSCEGGTFTFASEIKALLHACPAKINAAELASFLGANPNEFTKNTLFAGIQKFPPAHFVFAQLDELRQGTFRFTSYWTLHVNSSLESFNDKDAKQYCEQYIALLSDSVRLRLQADVPVGSALSGGLDSSTIVWLVNKQLGNESQARQHTFSSVYPSPGHRHIDESQFIDQMAQLCRIQSHRVTPSHDAVSGEYVRMIYAMDEPPDGTCMSGWFTFKLVRSKGVVVTLDGQGADEQLGGYLYYYTYWLAQSRNLLTDYRSARQFPQARNFVLAGMTCNLAKKAGLNGLVVRALRSKGKLHNPYQPLNERLRNDTHSVLYKLLNYADRASMAHAVESRMPFMDYRLAEFFALLPATYKIHRGWTKYVARLAMAEHLPASIVWRRDKMGWPSPDRQWFQGPLKEWAVRTIEANDMLKELGCASSARALIEAGNIHQFIKLLNAALWHDVFLTSAWKSIELPGAASQAAPIVREKSSAAEPAELPRLSTPALVG